MKPIFICSVGIERAEALQLCVQSIRKYNRKNTIVCFGDSRTPKGDYKRESIWTYTDKIFESFLDYRYNGPNSFAKEWFNLSRWFVFHEYCIRHGYDEFFTCDTDVLVFSSVDSILSKESDYGWTSGCAVFNKLSPLAEFCSWFPKALTEQYKEPGNWVDMGIWMDFSVHTCTSRNVRFFNEVQGDSAVDPNLALTEGWEKNGEGKKIVFTRKGPMGNYQGRPVRLLTLHCWGSYIEQMEELMLQASAA